MLFNLLLQDPREEWKAFWKLQLFPNPLVTKVALLVLSTSAEATPSERTFSVAGAISKRRGGGKLKPETLSNLTMLQRATRNSLEGKTRLARAKRLKTMAIQPLPAAAQPLAAALPAAVVAPQVEAMDDFSDEFEARLQADVELIEAMINKGELAFITVGDHVELLEQDRVDQELLEQTLELTSSHNVINSDDFDFEYSLENLLSAFSGGAVGSQQPGSVMSDIEASDS